MRSIIGERFFDNFLFLLLPRNILAVRKNKKKSRRMKEIKSAFHKFKKKKRKKRKKKKERKGKDSLNLFDR